MNRAAPTWLGGRPGIGFPVEWLVPSALVPALGLATIAAVILTNGNPLAAVALILGAAVLWAVFIAPVRNTLFLLFFFGLATDRPGDGNEMWSSPFVSIGGVLMHNVSTVVPIDALKVSGLIVMLGLLMIVRAHRLLSGRVVDTPGAILPAPPMNWALAASFSTVVFLLIWGLANGGDAKMAKVQVQVFIPTLMLAFVLGPSLRGCRDYRTLARVLLAAACCKAIMAMWIWHVLPSSVAGPWGVMQPVTYATSHGDSLLFACASLILIVPFFFRPTRRHAMTFLLIAPILAGGMIANNRRLVWVQLGAGIVLMVLMNPHKWAARRLIRTVVLLSPILLVYFGIGWNYPSRVFAPVSMVRSLVNPLRSDGSVDRSTLFRDVENYNLISTFIRNPALGRGFGHAFDTPVSNDDMSGFKEYRYLPHNSVLGLMGFAGGLGFIGLFTPLVVALFFAARAQAFARIPEDAMAAAVVIGALAAYLIHLWGDIGFTEPTSIFTVGAAFAIAGQLAVSTGAWRVGQGRAAPTTMGGLV